MTFYQKNNIMIKKVPRRVCLSVRDKVKKYFMNFQTVSSTGRMIPEEGF